MLGTTAVVAARTGTARLQKLCQKGCPKLCSAPSTSRIRNLGHLPELFGELARELERASFAGHAGQLRVLQAA